MIILDSSSWVYVPGYSGTYSGMPRQSVSRLERGRVAPRMATIRRLAAALGVPPEELVVRDGAEGNHDA